MAWLSRTEPWPTHLDSVLEEHVGPAMAAYNLDLPAFGKALGEHWATVTWGCAFEDFLTRRFAPDAQNPVEAYLRQRGWKEGPQPRVYMTALQGSVVSLYEVSDVVPGRSLRVRDLIRDGEPMLVHERSATQTLKQWDRIAARVVQPGHTKIFAGGLLPFTVSGSQLLIGQLRDQFKAAFRHTRRVAPIVGALEGWKGTDEELQRAAPLFTTAWLLDTLPRALGLAKPKLINTEGDDIVFHTLTFPINPHATEEEVSQCLNKVPSLLQESAAFWNWVGEVPKRKPAKSSNARLVIHRTTMEDGSLVLGNVELKGCSVSLSVNSAPRAERGQAVLANALGDLVGPPATEIETVDEFRARPGANAPAEPPVQMPAEMLQQSLDRHYRALLDEPVPMLGNISPRAASRSARGRRNVAAWLKQLENATHRDRDENDPLATYDVTWLWRELKVEDLRR